MAPERNSGEAGRGEEEQSSQKDSSGNELSSQEKPISGPGAGKGVFFKRLAALHPERMRDIASLGGQTSQANGTAHAWTPEDGRAANALRKTHGRRGSRKPA